MSKLPPRDLKDLRVCFIAGTLGQGGAERQLYYILKTLRRYGAHPRLLTLTRGEYWEEPIRALGVPVTWVGQASGRWRRALRIIAELRRDPPDVIQNQHFYTNLYAALAARALRVPEVGSVRSNTVSEVESHSFIIGHISLRAPRAIAANSQVAIRNALALGVPGERLHLLPNVIDTDYFRPVTRPPRRPVRLIAVARLSREKRIDRFLSLVARVSRRTSWPINATVVGDGPLRPQLERQAAALGLLPDVVKFSGRATDMRQVYQAADVLVLTSDFEGTPNVVLEAMASGVPIIAAQVGGIPEIVEHGMTGYLSAPDDEASMAEGLLDLISEPAKRATLGANGRAYVEAHHSLDCLPGALSKLYRQVLS
jgi:glycosyltransferase involved in cell wall biosynthesis